MDNSDKPTPWRERQARWSIPDLTLAIHLQCKECNQEERFLDSNDCVSSCCALYPFRPGSCRPEVSGVWRAIRRAQTGGKAFQPREDGALGRAGRQEVGR